MALRFSKVTEAACTTTGCLNDAVDPGVVFDSLSQMADLTLQAFPYLPAGKFLTHATHAAIPADNLDFVWDHSEASES